MKKAGARGIIKNQEGHMMFVFTEALDYCTNNEAETKAAIIGLRYSHNMGLRNIVLEMDSKIIVDMIKGTNKPSWKLQQLIEEIQEKLKRIGGSVQHCYREANSVADILSKLGSIHGQTCVLKDHQNLPKSALGAYRLDKCGMANFRIRKLKIGIG